MPEGSRPLSMVLATACPDTTGVLAAVAGFLASHNYRVVLAVSNGGKIVVLK